MNKVALTLACAASTLCGKQLPTSNKFHSTSGVDQSFTRWADAAFNPSRPFALVLLALHPAGAFSPSGAGSCFSLRSSNHAGSHPVVLCRRRRCRTPALAEAEVAPLSSRRALLLASAASCLASSLPSSAAVEPRPGGFLPLLQVDIGRNALNTVEAEFSPEFSSFLARFLVNNEQVTRRWWEQKQREGGAFAIANLTSAKLPFRQYADDLQEKYLTETFSTLITSVEVGLEKFENAAGITKFATLLQRRYTSPKQKRRLAQLFSLVENPSLQPTSIIKALLGEADNARATAFSLPLQSTKEQPLYIFSSSDPQVMISPPPGTGGRVAKAKPIMRGTGRWRAAQLLDGGLGYADDEMPEVTISLPQPGSTASIEREAVLRATARNGKVVDLVLEEAGAGYLSADGSLPVSVELRIAPPASNSSGARAARAKLLPEYKLVGLEVVDGGSGYNLDEPPTAVVRERVNTTSPEGRKDVTASAVMKAGNVRDGEDKLLGPAALQKLEEELQIGLSLSWEVRKASTNKSALVPTLLSLPSALVPRLDKSTGTYRLPVSIPSGAFGKRASVPVETQPPLSPGDLSRIFLAGALCSSTAHAVLVPLDVVKTTLQQDAQRFSGPIECAKDLIEKEGPGSLFKGAGATVVGYSIAGALSFGLLELFSRALRDAAGPGIALFFGLPLLTFASALATVIVAAVLCPFEAVRVKSVKSGESGLEVLQEVLENDGIGGLFGGLVPLLLKDVPYVVTKFIVFDTLLDKLVSIATDEGLLSTPAVGTGITALAGAVAGLAAVLVSQPADTIFTLTNEGPGISLSSAVDEVLKTPALIGNGLGPRLLFGVLLVSLQFFLFTLLRSGFGVSQDDLTLVWDALAPLLN